MSRLPKHFELTAKIEWVGRDGGGYLCHMEGLGIVEIFREAKGQPCVEINGMRHSSAWRYSVDNVKHEMTQELRRWAYLNQYKVSK